jgi:hypothetical protein
MSGAEPVCRGLNTSASALMIVSDSDGLSTSLSNSPTLAFSSANSFPNLTIVSSCCWFRLSACLHRFFHLFFTLRNIPYSVK